MAEPLSFMGGSDDLQEKYELIPIYCFEGMKLMFKPARRRSPEPGSGVK